MLSQLVKITNHKWPLYGSWRHLGRLKMEECVGTLGWGGGGGDSGGNLSSTKSLRNSCTPDVATILEAAGIGGVLPHHSIAAGCHVLGYPFTPPPSW